MLFVVAFHAFPNTLAGGFIGVDIFFVISGFLISTIIMENLKGGTFSFVEFYSRRIKRIFPALLVILISSYVLGWFTLLAVEYKQLGKHIAGGAGFISNIMLWGESGYFDNAGETKPLLHLWSLGIEEQFYIVWPFFLWGAWKLGFKFLTIVLVALIVSFVANIVVTNSNVVAAFYSPLTRFWELLIGSGAAYATMHKNNLLPVRNGKFADIQSLVGVSFIVFGVLTINKRYSFPGWWAVAPTAGAVLIIASDTHAWFNRSVLSNRVLVWFGLISFPLYLWHYPLLSFARIIEGAAPSIEMRIVAMSLAVVLAWLTYRLIERPVRFGSYGETKALCLIVLMAVVGYAGFQCYEREGFNGLGYRIADRQEFSEYFENAIPRLRYFETIGLSEKYRFECGFYDVAKHVAGAATQTPVSGIDVKCTARDEAYAHAVFIWGDSHAQQLYFGLKNNLPADWQILQVASSGCARDINASKPSTTSYCAQSNFVALKTIIETKPDVVIVAQDFGHDAQSFNRTAEKLREYGVGKVVLMGPTPHWSVDLPKLILRKLWVDTPRRTRLGVNQEIVSQNAALEKNVRQSDAVLFVNLIDLLCNDEGCLTYIGDSKKTGITTWDYGHLTPIASDYVAKNLLAPAIVGKKGELSNLSQRSLRHTSLP